MHRPDAEAGGHPPFLKKREEERGRSTTHELNNIYLATIMQSRRFLDSYNIEKKQQVLTQHVKESPDRRSYTYKDK